ncbi:MAG: hypothetical protein IGS48_02665 [Oscillatoriales cyanobacterium C42_A2020_001]|nr:hypothetical protein [Leptolyngbyaceae cyanobacterium C42_A2020_001]
MRKEAAIALGTLPNSASLQALHRALDDPDREQSWKPHQQEYSIFQR